MARETYDEQRRNAVLEMLDLARQGGDKAAEGEVKKAGEKLKADTEKALQPTSGLKKVGQDVVGKTVESFAGAGKRIAESILPSRGGAANIGPVGIAQGLLEHAQGKKQSSGEKHPLEDIGNLLSGIGSAGFELTGIPIVARAVESAVNEALKSKDNKNLDVTQLIRDKAQQMGADPDAAHTLFHLITKVPMALLGMALDPGKLLTPEGRKETMDALSEHQSAGELAGQLVTAGLIARQIGKASKAAIKEGEKPPAGSAIPPDPGPAPTNPALMPGWLEQRKARLAWEKTQKTAPGKAQAAAEFAAATSKAKESKNAVMTPEQAQAIIDQTNKSPEAGGGGSTVNAKTGEMMREGEDLTSGHSVGLKEGGVVLEPEQFTPEALIKYHSELPPGVNFGTWLNGGKVYLDRSQVIADRAEALAKAREEGQQAIRDHATGTDIPVDENAQAPVPGATDTIQQTLPTGIEPQAGPGGRVLPQPEPAGRAPGGMPGDAAEAPINEPIGVPKAGTEPAPGGDASPAAEVPGADQGAPLQPQPAVISPAQEPIAAPMPAEVVEPRPAHTVEQAKAVAREGIQQALTDGDLAHALNSAKALQEGRGGGDFFTRISESTGLNHAQLSQLYMERQAAQESARGVESPKPAPPAETPTVELPAPTVNGTTDATARAARQERIKQHAKRIFSDWQKLLQDESGVLRPGSEIKLDMKKNLEVWNDLVAEGAALLHDGVRGKKAWMDAALQMAGDHAELLKPQLEDLWADVKAKAPGIIASPKFGEMPSVKQMEKDIVANRPAMGWYRGAPAELGTVYGESNAKLAAGVYASTSQGTEAATQNITNAHYATMKILTADDPAKVRFTTSEQEWGRYPDAVVANLNRVVRGEEPSGSKINPYYKHLAGIADPNVDIPLDTQMFRYVGIAPEAGTLKLDSFGNPVTRVSSQGTTYNVQQPFSPTQPQITMYKTLLNRLASRLGVEPIDAQAALWVAQKSGEEFAKLEARAKADGWSKDRLAQEMQDIRDSFSKPFAQLIRERLGDNIVAEVQAELAGQDVMDYFSQRAMAAAAENPHNAEPAMTASFAGAGTEIGTARKLASAVMDAYQKSGLADERGSIGWVNNAKLPEFDKAATQKAVTERIDKWGVKELLGRNLLDPKDKPSLDQVKAMRPTVEGALGVVNRTVQTIRDGGAVEPGQLYHDVTVAAAVAEKARNAEARFGPDAVAGYGPASVDAVTPTDLTKLAHRLHEEMPEADLYAKLRDMEPGQQALWLANMYRMRTMPGGLKKMAMALWINAQLSGGGTVAKSFGSHTVGSIPLAMAIQYVGEQVSRVGQAFGGKPGILPGAGARLSASIMETLRDQARMMDRGDWETLRLQREMEGEVRPIIPNPETPLDNMVNAVGGLPGAVLGNIRTPVKIAMRKAYLNEEAYRAATRDVEADPSLVFEDRHRYHNENPSEEMLRNSNNYSDEWSFTKDLDGALGLAQRVVRGNDAMRFFLSPFARVEMNLVNLGMEMTPGLNFLSKSWRDDFFSNDPVRKQQAIAKVVTGSAVLAIAYGLAGEGLVTGDGPTDPHSKKVWLAAGNEPNSIMWNGKPVMSHNWLGPISGLLSAGADLQQTLAHMDENTAQKTVFDAALAFTNVITHAGYLTTMMDVASAIKDFIGGETSGLKKALERKVASLVPSVVRTISGITDEGKPVRAPGDSFFQHVMDQAQLPGWSRNTPPQRNDFTGEIVSKFGSIRQIMDAFEGKRLETDPVANTVMALGMNEGKQRYGVAGPRDYIGGKTLTDGMGIEPDSVYGGVPLSRWEKDRLAVIRTREITINDQTLHDRLLTLINSDEFKQHWADAKKDIPGAEGQPSQTAKQRQAEGWAAMQIQSIWHAFNTKAEATLLAEDPHLRWMVGRQRQLQANLLSPSDAPRENPLGPEPPLTVYPRPGQIGAK